MACLAEGLKESMERLQVDYIDIFQCHDIEFRSLDQVSQHVQLGPLQLSENAFVCYLIVDATVALAGDLQHFSTIATSICKFEEEAASVVMLAQRQAPDNVSIHVQYPIQSCD